MHDSVETILLYSSVTTSILASAFLSKIWHNTHMHAHSQTCITKRGKAKGSRGCGTPSTSRNWENELEGWRLMVFSQSTFGCF